MEYRFLGASGLRVSALSFGSCVTFGDQIDDDLVGLVIVARGDLFGQRTIRHRLDLVAVHRTPNVRSRQIIVARLEDEVMVKRYRQEGRTVWLLPENQDFVPIEVDLDKQHLVIEGVVVGLLRNGRPFRH